MISPADHLAGLGGPASAFQAPFGAAVRAMSEAALRRGGVSVYVANDDRGAMATERLAHFFCPALRCLSIPAWDCLPYDRASPGAMVAGRRCWGLTALSRMSGSESPVLVITTIASLMQRTPPRCVMSEAVFGVRVGGETDRAGLLGFVSSNGYVRAEVVREPGEYSVRGGIFDIFPPGKERPVRLDHFGDRLESIRLFDADSQKSLACLEGLDLSAASEIVFTPDSIECFRLSYAAAFGVVRGPVCEAVAAGVRARGVEQYLPLFYQNLETLFDYLGEDVLVGHDVMALDIASDRFAEWCDYYRARRGVGEGETPGSVLPPGDLYMCADDLRERLGAVASVGFSGQDGTGRIGEISLRTYRARDFAPERAGKANVFDALAGYSRDLRGQKKRIVFAAWSEGSADRLQPVLAEHGIEAPVVASLPEGGSEACVLAALPVESGFVSDDLAVISETDVLGDRMARVRPRGSAVGTLFEAASLVPGDLVVHSDHGIGRFEGLIEVTVDGANRDCLELVYAEGAKVLLPVENIELLTRYGSDAEAVSLDRLGGASWQARKARVKKRILDMAEELVGVAAERATRKAPVIEPPSGEFDEFCVQFSHEETDDQLGAVDDVLSDLASGTPSDRVICGDVGFGKTEVALRAAFATMMSGYQVALIAPTTVLARQHYLTVCERMSAWPFRIGRLSRLVQSGELVSTRKDLESGVCDMVVGTHAILSARFADLGLLIVDEEQRFGVRHKERMKALKTDLHVLTLSATPIPRTLQSSLSGIRDLSLIATPPADRLSVRTHLVVFDPVTLREALLRERHRGGQSYVVAPRISDLGRLEEVLRERVPEVSFLTAHGQMSPHRLDGIMSEFHAGQADVLLSTSIVESGLDIPRANTLVVYRADMFGLAQLYQIRGRIGRSKVRAYAYLTTSETRPPSDKAVRILDLLRSLDSLGAGFTLASHDLDIRGGGNLLGDAQSGHVREVGAELYQKMVSDAVADTRGQKREDTDWSPRIDVGVSALIPDDYVRDPATRLSLYRRLSRAATDDQRDALADELADRFGPLPESVKSLLVVSRIKASCRRLGVSEISAGKRGVVVSFRDRTPVDAVLLAGWVSERSGTARLRPDSTLVYSCFWSGDSGRLAGAEALLTELGDRVGVG